MDRMCSLKRAEMSELEAVYALIDQRQEMRQFYEHAARERRLHVLRVNGSEEIVGAVRIGDAADAMESHTIVLSGMIASGDALGAYDAILSACELIGKLRGKERMTVLCAQGDEPLSAFLAKRGFTQAETRVCGAAFEREIQQGCSCGG